MSTAIWKFHVTVPTGMIGDVDLALRSAGFPAAEASKLYEAIFEMTELSFFSP